MGSNDLLFSGVQNDYSWWSGELDPQHYWDAVQEDLKLHVEDTYNASAQTLSVTVTAFVKVNRYPQYTGMGIEYVGGQLVWRRAPTQSNPDPSWNVIKDFSISAGTASVNMAQPDSNNWCRINGTYSFTVTGASGGAPAVQIGFRPNSSNPFGHTIDSGYFSYYGYYAFSKDSEPVYQEINSGGGGGGSGGVRIWNGSSWQTYTPYIWNGSSWVAATPYIWNGSQWKQCT